MEGLEVSQLLSGGADVVQLGFFVALLKLRDRVNKLEWELKACVAKINGS